MDETPGRTLPDSTVSLRRVKPQDAAAVARINGHPEVQPNLMQSPYAFEERWAQLLADNLLPGRTDFVLVAERGGEVLGCAGLHPLGTYLRRRHAMSLGISVAPEAHGQGVGSTLMAALCDYADHWGQVLRIELSVFADNARAIALYRRFGFEHEGTHRGYALRAGRYVDAWSMARLHPSPPSIGA